jgi:acyl carrier protein phosphodiesterase
MNWLAHLFLAQPTVESRLGNLLGDLVKGRERDCLNADLQLGLQCHLAIDRFTDRHIIVKRSKQRISQQYRRFAGISIDVFFDHFLATNWERYSNISLKQFTTTIYESFQEYLNRYTLPEYARKVIQRAIAEDWLGSYYYLSGVENTLKRISWKLTRRRNKLYDLTPIIVELQQNYAELEEDFLNFFPELMLHIDEWYVALNLT